MKKQKTSMVISYENRSILKRVFKASLSQFFNAVMLLCNENDYVKNKIIQKIEKLKIKK